MHVHTRLEVEGKERPRSCEREVTAPAVRRNPIQIAKRRALELGEAWAIDRRHQKAAPEHEKEGADGLLMRFDIEPFDALDERDKDLVALMHGVARRGAPGKLPEVTVNFAHPCQ